MIKRHLIGCGIKLALEKGNVLVWDWLFGVCSRDCRGWCCFELHCVTVLRDEF